MPAAQKQLIHVLQIAEHKVLSASESPLSLCTSQTEREEGSGIAHAHKTWTPAVPFHVGNLLMHAISKP